MKKTVLEFVRRGLTACGFGPMILAILYLILQRTAGLETLTVHEVCLGIVSLSVLAFIAGGETVVRITGEGLGGRNQELAFAAAEGIAGLTNTAVFSVGSDGTDGPTDAAGGYVDGDTAAALAKLGISIPAVLKANDSYYALKNVDGIVFTGPTGTNVNDVCCLLIKR